MKIMVRLSSGENVALSVLSTDKIISVKRQIQNLKGISPDEQVIRYQETRLNNADILSENSIRNGSILTLNREDLMRDRHAKKGRCS